MYKKLRHRRHSDAVGMAKAGFAMGSPLLERFRFGGLRAPTLKLRRQRVDAVHCQNEFSTNDKESGFPSNTKTLPDKISFQFLHHGNMDRLHSHLLR